MGGQYKNLYSGIRMDSYNLEKAQYKAEMRRVSPHYLGVPPPVQSPSFTQLIILQHVIFSTCGEHVISRQNHKAAYQPKPFPILSGLVRSVGATSLCHAAISFFYMVRHYLVKPNEGESEFILKEKKILSVRNMSLTININVVVLKPRFKRMLPFV